MRTHLHPKAAPAWSGALVVVAFLVFGCGPKIPKYDYNKEPDPRTTEFVLGDSDEIAVTVWKNKELSTQARIRPDGTITVPLVGDVIAKGKTPSQLRREIRDKLSEFIKLAPSELSVSVREVNSYRFAVSGEVARPGIFNSTYYVTVAEAIALAGGFTRFANSEDIVLMRRDVRTGKVRRIPISYPLIASGNHPAMNLVLMAGDSLYVP